jgi:hypothetical protein
MGAGQPQILAQELHQQGAGLDIRLDGIAVHNQGDLGHSTLSFAVPSHIGGTVNKTIPAS